MSESLYHIVVGQYQLSVPNNVMVETTMTPRDFRVPDQQIYTHWKVNYERYFFTLRLLKHNLEYLENTLIYQTKKTDHTMRTMEINGIKGVSVGDYNENRTWIDWWFRKTDITLSLHLQSQVFPSTQPTDQERNEHLDFIHSIKYLA